MAIGKVNIGISSNDKINGIENNYLIKTGETINKGDFVKFVDNLSKKSLSSVGSAQHKVHFTLPNDRVLLFNNETKGCYIGKLVDGELTYGEELVISTSHYLKDCLDLGNNNILLVMGTSGYYLGACIVNVNNMTITLVESLTSMNSEQGTVAGTTLYGDTIYVFYLDYSDESMRFFKLGLSGTTLTTIGYDHIYFSGISHKLNTNSTPMKVIHHTSNYYHMFYVEDYSASNELRAVRLEIRGDKTVYTVGSPVTIESNTSNDDAIFVQKIDSNLLIGHNASDKFKIYTLYGTYTLKNITILDTDNVSNMLNIGKDLYIIHSGISDNRLFASILSYKESSTYPKITFHEIENIVSTYLAKDAQVINNETICLIFSRSGYSDYYRCCLDLKYLLAKSATNQEISGIAKQNGIGGQEITIITL